MTDRRPTDSGRSDRFPGPIRPIVIAVVALALLIGGAVTVAWAVAQGDEAGEGDTAASPSSPAPSPADGDEPSSDATCPEPTTEVANGDQLQTALDEARPCQR